MVTNNFDNANCAVCLYGCIGCCSAPKGIFWYAMKNDIDCSMNILKLKNNRWINMRNVIECLKISLEIGNVGYENVKCDIQNNTINFDLVIEYPSQKIKSYKITVEEVI